MADQPAPDNYLTRTQAAELLGVTPRTIDHRIADGSLRAHRFGPRVVRIARSDLERALTVVQRDGRN